MQHLNPFQGEEHRPFFLSGGKSAALLIHGFPGTPAELRPLANTLHIAGWTVQGPLLPGFGAQVDTLFERDYTEWIAAVETSLAELQQKYNPVLLVGYSMGAALALQVAQTRRPNGLILIAPFWKMGTAWQQIIGMLLKPFFKSIRPFKKADFSNPQVRRGIAGFFPGANLDDPDVQQELRDLSIPTRIFEQLHHLGRGAYRAAAHLKLSTLVIQGAADEVVRLDRTRKLVQQFATPPHYVELPAGHDLIKPTQQSWPEVTQTVLFFAGKFTGQAKR